MADYTIQRGDTLSQIAQRYGTTVQALAQANGISNPDRISAGATIRIPDASTGGAATPPASPPPVPPVSTPGSYTVRQGDTLSRIAMLNNTSVEELARLNGIANPNRIGVGQVLQVPQTRGTVPLPPGNPVRPGVPGPPMEPRTASTQSPVDPNYVPAGWLPVPPPVGTPAGREWTTRGRNPGSIGAPDGDPAYNDIYGAPQAGGPSPGPRAPVQPDAWQGRQGDAYASQVQRRGRGSITANDIPDPANLDLRQMSEFEQRWMAAGQNPDDLPAWWQQARYLRTQQFEMERQMAERQAQQQQERDAAMYRVDNGTNPRVAPPAPPVDRSIGEGQYLPNEVLALGQLGASTQNYPGVPALGALIPTGAMPPPPGTPAIGGYYLAPQQQPSLGQLMRRTPSSQPYYGV